MENIFGLFHYHLIGFDLGSEIAHYAPIEYRRLVLQERYWPDKSERIEWTTELDPPLYGFENDLLSTPDANYVWIIHSNSTQLSAVSGITLEKFEQPDRATQECYFRKHIEWTIW